MTGIYGINPIARIMADLLQAQQPPEQAAFIDDNDGLLHTQRWNVPVEFNIRSWKEHILRSGQQQHMLIALGEKNLLLRKRIFDEFSELPNLRFVTLRDAGSQVAADAVIEPGNLLCRGVMIGHEVQLKSNSVFWAGSVVEHNSVIGESCYIAPNVTISGFVSIGSCTLVGSGAVILPEIAIGSNCIIGAGAVVNRNVPDNTVVAGNPARVLRSNTIH